MVNLKKEVLLLDDPSKSRYTIFPIKYQDIYDEYKKQKAAIWFEEEVPYKDDVEDWSKLSSDEQHFIEYILAFFAGSDGIVLENLVERFCSEIKVPEVRLVYGVQTFIEAVHSNVYSLLIDTFISSPTKKAYLFNALDEISCIKKKGDWAIKWIGSSASFATRLVAFAVVEGIFFSGAFCAIYWLKHYRKILTKALCLSNEWIARDESMHTQFAVLLYTRYIVNKLSREEVVDMFKEAVQIEKEFICEAIPCKLIGMNSVLMSQYIEYVADILLMQLGYEELWGAKNPFDFMAQISLQNNSNFFEKKVTEYSSAYYKVDNTFVLDANF